MDPYIPTRQADMRTWALNFAALITAAPATYGLTAGNATTIQTAVDDFDAALTLALDPTTRTPTTIADKDAKKAVMLDTVRPFAQQVKNNAGVSNENKAALGLNIDDESPTSVAPPVTQPLLSIQAATPLQHTLRYADVNTPTLRAKPEGVSALQLFRHIGANAPASYTDWEFVGAFTRNPVESSFASGSAGMDCQYVGRWQNRKGEVGPWSSIANMIVVA